jgi:hypothetical protein
MENPRSLKWALGIGYKIIDIHGTNRMYCTVGVYAYIPPLDHPRLFEFLMSTSYMARHYKALFNEISTTY